MDTQSKNTTIGCSEPNRATLTLNVFQEEDGSLYFNNSFLTSDSKADNIHFFHTGHYEECLACAWFQLEAVYNMRFLGETYSDVNICLFNKDYECTEDLWHNIEEDTLDYLIKSVYLHYDLEIPEVVAHE